MVEREVRSSEDFLEFIYKLKDARNMTIVATEDKGKIGHGTISRWKRASPSLDNVLKVLSVLDAKMVLCTDHLEEKCNEVENSEIDEMILSTAEKALKNCNSFSEKVRLYKVLQAFL